MKWKDDWLGYGSREAFKRHFEDAIVRRTRDISISEALEQYYTIVFPPPSLYIVKSHIVRDGELAVDHLSLCRISLRQGRQNLLTRLSLGNITLDFSKGDQLNMHNGEPQPGCNTEQLRSLYNTLAARVRLLEQNMPGGVAVSNLEHLNGMYDLESLGIPTLRTPYFTPEPGSVEEILLKNRNGFPDLSI